MTQRVRRLGAPVTPRNRVAVGFRFSPELYERIRVSATTSGRSITQEVELLLEKGLRDEALERTEMQLAEILRRLPPSEPSNVWVGNFYMPFGEA